MVHHQHLEQEMQLNELFIERGCKSYPERKKLKEKNKKLYKEMSVICEIRTDGGLCRNHRE